MRRAGQNPTDVEVLDIINRIDDGTDCLDFKVTSTIKVANGFVSKHLVENHFLVSKHPRRDD